MLSIREFAFDEIRFIIKRRNCCRSHSSVNFPTPNLQSDQPNPLFSHIHLTCARFRKSMHPCVLVLHRRRELSHAERCGFVYVDMQKHWWRLLDLFCHSFINFCAIIITATTTPWNPAALPTHIRGGCAAVIEKPCVKAPPATKRTRQQNHNRFDNKNKSPWDMTDLTSLLWSCWKIHNNNDKLYSQDSFLVANPIALVFSGV